VCFGVGFGVFVFVFFFGFWVVLLFPRGSVDWVPSLVPGH
jgi:hypothetical protein